MGAATAPMLRTKGGQPLPQSLGATAPGRSGPRRTAPRRGDPSEGGGGPGPAAPRLPPGDGGAGAGRQQRGCRRLRVRGRGEHGTGPEGLAGGDRGSGFTLPFAL